MDMGIACTCAIPLELTEAFDVNFGIHSLSQPHFTNILRSKIASVFRMMYGTCILIYIQVMSKREIIITCWKDLVTIRD